MRRLSRPHSLPELERKEPSLWSADCKSWHLIKRKLEKWTPDSQKGKVSTLSQSPPPTVYSRQSPKCKPWQHATGQGLTRLIHGCATSRLSAGTEFMSLLFFLKKEKLNDEYLCSIPIAEKDRKCQHLTVAHRSEMSKMKQYKKSQN